MECSPPRNRHLLSATSLQQLRPFTEASISEQLVLQKSRLFFLGIRLEGAESIKVPTPGLHRGLTLSRLACFHLRTSLLDNTHFSGSIFLAIRVQDRYIQPLLYRGIFAIWFTIPCQPLLRGIQLFFPRSRFSTLSDHHTFGRQVTARPSPDHTMSANLPREPRPAVPTGNARPS